MNAGNGKSTVRCAGPGDMEAVPLCETKNLPEFQFGEAQA